MSELMQPTHSAHFVYASFAHAKQQLAGIEAIDYFLAKQLTQSLGRPNEPLLAHLFMLLSTSVRDGHSCLPLTAIANRHWAVATDKQGIISHQGYVFPPLASLQQALASLLLTAEAEQPVVVANEHLYLRRFYTFEQQLVDNIQQRLTPIKAFDTGLVHQYLAQVFIDDSEVVATTNEAIDWQKVAVANALNKRFSVIAGGPGTGKTYTVTRLFAVLALLAQQHVEPLALHIAMVAPTGKAAQRLAESIKQAKRQLQHQLNADVLALIPEQAYTIHRLLGVIANQHKFRHDRHNLLTCNVLLIDEASMVDLALMTRIFEALTTDCKVILLGDAEQLPAVLTGNVLADIAPMPHVGYSTTNVDYLQRCTGYRAIPRAKQHGLDYLTILTKSRRFDGQGGIGQLARLVIAGQSSASWQLLTEASTACSVKLLQGELNFWLKPLVMQYYLPLLQLQRVADAFVMLNQFRLLCVTRQGAHGVENFNQLIKQQLIDAGQTQCQAEFYHGQPIMIEENHYGLGLYNGDLGFIWRNEAGELMAVFENVDSGYQWLLLTRLPKFSCVYAMTVHKTQGSEFEHVVIVLPEQADHPLLSRELLYTGLTRAKLSFSALANRHVWLQCVEQKVNRFSQLADKLKVHT